MTGSDAREMDPAASGGTPHGGGVRVGMSPGGSRPIIPDWLVNLAALGWRVIAIAALVIVLWQLALLLWTVTASVAIAVVISASFAPFAVRLRNRGRSRAAAAAIVWVVALAVIAGVLLLLAFALVPYLGTVMTRISDGIVQLQTLLATYDVPPTVTEALGKAVDALRADIGTAVSGIVSSAAGVVTVAILASFLVFFFLKDGDRAWIWIFQAVGERKRERITQSGEDALERVGGYLRGTTILSAIIAGSDLVFLILLGVPLAGPLSVLVFFSGYIPYFGGIVTTGLILLVTLATQGTGAAIVLILLIAVRNSILSSVVRPAIYGRTVRIHPALVLVALPAGFQLAGIIGLFAAVPMTAVILAVASAAVAIADPGPTPTLPALVPPWLDRVAQWSWRLLVGLAFLALGIGMFVAIPLVLVPIVLATIVTATLAPLTRYLVMRGRPHGQAAAIATGGGFLAVLAILVLTMVALVNQAGALGLAIGDGAAAVNDAAEGTLGISRAAIDGAAVEMVSTVRAIASALGTVTVVVVLSTLLAFYFLKDGAALWQRITLHLRPDAAGAVTAAAVRAFDVLSGYMIGTGAISLVGAGSQLVIMLVLGIPLALPIFVLSFFLCFIPYIGGFISTGIALLVTIAVGTPSDVAIMAVFTLVFNIVQGNIVTPLVYGKTVHLHPAIILVAVPAGAAIAGILGMFLVVPVMGVVAATWRTTLKIIGLPRDPALTEGPQPGVGATPPDRAQPPLADPASELPLAEPGTG